MRPVDYLVHSLGSKEVQWLQGLMGSFCRGMYWIYILDTLEFSLQQTLPTLQSVLALLDVCEYDLRKVNVAGVGGELLFAPINSFS